MDKDTGFDHIGMVIDEDGETFVVFKPETIKYIISSLGIEAGDVVRVSKTEDEDPVVTITKVEF